MLKYMGIIIELQTTHWSCCVLGKRMEILLIYWVAYIIGKKRPRLLSCVFARVKLHGCYLWATDLTPVHLILAIPVRLTSFLSSSKSHFTVSLFHFLIFQVPIFKLVFQIIWLKFLCNIIMNSKISIGVHGEASLEPILAPIDLSFPVAVEIHSGNALEAHYPVPCFFCHSNL